MKIKVKNIDTKEAEKIITNFNKANTGQSDIKKTQSTNKNKAKTKKISKK